MSARQTRPLNTVRRWLTSPDTIGAWFVSVSLWASMLFAVALWVGTSVGYRSVGLSAGLFAGGLAVLFLTDQMWQRLEISD